MADAKTAVKTKNPVTPEQKARRKAVRLIGWSTWVNDYKAANPKATKEERKAAWAAARKAQAKTGRRVLRALEKKGFAVTQTGAPVKS